LAAIVVCTVWAATDVVLKDGRVIEGTEVRRDGENYILILESGDSIVIPGALVEAVRLTTPEPFTKADPIELAAPPPEGPTGIVESGAQTLAGTPVRPPTPSEQLKVFGPPAQFQKSLINPDWQPKSDWDMDPERANNFAPSEWADDIIDPNWEPESAFDRKDDALADSRSKWQKSLIDNSWTPTDGFAR
jgi:hypothetical protein